MVVSLPTRLRRSAAVAVAIGATLLAAVAVPGPATAAAGSPAPPRDTAVDVALTSAIPKDDGGTCAGGGGTASRPFRVRVDSRGGRFFDYHVGAGVGIEAEAPVGFNPLTATDTDLATYNLPPRPSASDTLGLQGWTEAMAAYRPNLSVGAHETCQDLRRAPAVNCGPADGYCGNYAGYVGTLGNYTQVSARTTMPAFSNAQCYPGTGALGQSDSWVGLGGVYSGNLLQAGVDSFGNEPNIVPRPFYESVGAAPSPNNRPVTGPQIVGAGESLYYYVYVNSSHGVGFYVGSSAGWHFGPPTSTAPYASFDGSTAEVITENHDNYAGANYFNPARAPWSYSSATAQRGFGSTYGLSTQNPIRYTGTNSANNIIVERPLSFTSTTSFATNWYAC